MAEMRVEETKSTLVPCACGCGNRWEQHDGTLHFEGGGVYFRALLTREEASEPAIWLAVVSNAPAFAADDVAWVVTMHGNRDGARVEDPEASPVQVEPGFTGRKLGRNELMDAPGAAAFYFACADALMAQHSRLTPFLFAEGTQEG